MWKSSLFLRQRPRHLAHVDGLSWRLSGARPVVHRGCASISAADLQFGQPVHETHPHILNHGECQRALQKLLVGWPRKYWRRACGRVLTAKQ
jgi:hypothetical protein